MRLKKQTVKYTVQIELPRGMTPEHMKAYVSSAIKGCLSGDTTEADIRFATVVDLVDLNTLRIELLQVVKDY